MDRFNGLEIPESLAEALDPAQLALVVYDMQVGVLRQIDDGDRVLANVKRVLGAARERGVRTIFVRHYFLPTALSGVFQLRQAKLWQHKDAAADTRPLIPYGSPASSWPRGWSRGRTRRSSTRSRCPRSRARRWTSCCATAGCAAT